MKKIRNSIISLCTICALLFVSPINIFAATMYDDWSQNSWVGYNYTTQGGIVFAVQKMLNAAGMSLKVPGFNVSDGYFGNNTQAALIQYQRDYGLQTDGVAGTNTWIKFANHTFYVGNSGSIQIYESQYRSDWAYAHFEKDYYNGWCIRNDGSGDFYLCNEVHYTIRTFVPL